MIKYRIFKNSASLVIDGEAFSLSAEHPDYQTVIKLAKEENKEELLKILNHVELLNLGLTFKEGTLYYKNLALPNFFYSKFSSMKSKKELIPVINTWYNLEQKLSLLDKKRFGVHLKDSYLVWDDLADLYLYESQSPIFENTCFLQAEDSSLFRLIYENYGTVVNYIKSQWIQANQSIILELKRIITYDKKINLTFLGLGQVFKALTADECLEVLRRITIKSRNAEALIHLAPFLFKKLNKSQLKKFAPELLNQGDILSNFRGLLTLSPEYPVPDFSSISELRTIINREIARYDGNAFELRIDLTNPKLYKIQNAQISNELKVVIPESNFQLIEWGQKLNHCIGGYGKRIAQGKTYCFAIYSEITKEVLYTLEYNQGRIIQFQGKSNNSAQSLNKDHYKQVVEFLKNHELLQESVYNNL